MKRGVVDILKRGFDNTLANWPLILLRLFEIVIMLAAAIAALLAIIAPIALSLGIGANMTPDDLDNLGELLLAKWLVVIYALGVVLLLLIIMTAVHAFIEAGSARVYVDAERVAGPGMTGGRQRFKVFSMERWISGGKEGWWPIFWMYNATYGGAAMILLIPLVPTVVAMFIFREDPAPMALTGCFGIALTVLLMIPVGIVVGIWTNRAVASWAAHRGGVRDTLNTAWAEMKADFGRHILVAIALLVISFAVSGLFSSFGLVAAVGELMGRSRPSTMMFTVPLRMLASLLSTAVSAAIAAWYLAAFTALTSERH